ncbi:uncharacterized protein LOC134838998 isoform X2 [Symsagittifera roscoffensis]|uniref:uncharacterized protein LOC134838998 isoform X2 n=1 Tax=Symsagittifera roscoffensis TaxID=84072 RepID=UPI00307CAF12
MAVLSKDNPLQSSNCTVLFGPVNGEVKVSSMKSGSFGKAKNRKGSMEVRRYLDSGAVWVFFKYHDPPQLFYFNVATEKIKATAYPDKLYLSCVDNSSISYQFQPQYNLNWKEMFRKIVEDINTALRESAGKNSECSSPRIQTKAFNVEDDNNNVSPTISSAKRSAKSSFYSQDVCSASEPKYRSPFARNENSASTTVIPKATSVDLFKVKTGWTGETAKPSPLAQSPSKTLVVRSEDTAKVDGFVNLGNTCYMNAVLQALLAVYSFQCDLMRPEHVKAVCEEFFLPQVGSVFKSALDEFDHALVENKENEMAKSVNNGVKTRLYRVLIKLLADKMKRDKGLCQQGSLDSRTQFLHSLKKAVASVEQQFSGSLQNDAHEFLSLFLDILREEVVRINSRVSVKLEKSSSSNADSIVCPVNSNFQLTVRHTITCTGCQLKQEHDEKMLILSVNLPVEIESETVDRSTIFDLVCNYFCEESLEYTCDECGHREAKLTHELLTLPRVLVVHLKRYQVGGEGLIKDFRKVRISKYLSMTKLIHEHCELPSVAEGAFEEPKIADFDLYVTPKNPESRIDRLNLEEEKRENETDEDGFAPDNIEDDLLILEDEVKAETEALTRDDESHLKNISLTENRIMTNSSNTNKASGGAEAKLRTPTKTPPTKFFGRSSQKKKRLSLSDRKVISPIRKSCSLKSASNSDKGPRGRDRASRLFEDACVSREDLKYVHPEDAANVTPRKSKRIAIKEDEKCARKIEVSDKLQNSKAWKCDSKPQGSLADYWNHKGNRKTTETAVLRNEESADEGTDLAPGKKRKRANSPPPYRPTEDSDTEEKDDAEFQKAVQLSLLEAPIDDNYDEDLEKALALSRMEMHNGLEFPPGFEEQIFENEKSEDKFKGTVLGDDFLNSNGFDDDISAKCEQHQLPKMDGGRVNKPLNIIKEEEVVDIRSEDEEPELIEISLNPKSEGADTSMVQNGPKLEVKSEVKNDGMNFALVDNHEEEDMDVETLDDDESADEKPSGRTTPPPVDISLAALQVTSTPSNKGRKSSGLPDIAKLLDESFIISPTSENPGSLELSSYSMRTQDDVFSEIPAEAEESFREEDFIPFSVIGDPNSNEHVLNQRIEETETSIDKSSQDSKRDNKIDERTTEETTIVKQEDLKDEDEGTTGLVAEEESSAKTDEEKEPVNEEEQIKGLDPSHTYRLLSIICHLGHSVSGGHYVSDVYNPKTDSWSCFDDETVTNREERNVLVSRQKPGYIFFYMHQSIFPEAERERQNKADSAET